MTYWPRKFAHARTDLQTRLFFIPKLRLTLFFRLIFGGRNIWLIFSNVCRSRICATESVVRSKWRTWAMQCWTYCNFSRRDVFMQLAAPSWHVVRNILVTSGKNCLRTSVTCRDKASAVWLWRTSQFRVTTWCFQFLTTEMRTATYERQTWHKQHECLPKTV